MNEIGFAGGALLAGMVPLRRFVGLADEFEIVVGAVLAHVAQQLAELGYGEHIGRDLFAQGGHFQAEWPVSLFLIIGPLMKFEGRDGRDARGPLWLLSVKLTFLCGGEFKIQPQRTQGYTEQTHRVAVSRTRV